VVHELSGGGFGDLAVQVDDLGAVKAHRVAATVTIPSAVTLAQVHIRVNAGGVGLTER